MKIGIRTPSLKKSFKARTTGKLKRTIKKTVVPGNGKKGVGMIKDPKKAVYNKVYKNNETLVLQAANSKYQPMIFNSGEIRILGKLAAILNIKN